MDSDLLGTEQVPFDTVIVGGGPAGLSAAVYLGRARRSVAVLDSPWRGRSDWAQINHNFLGFPDGISIVELCARGRRQAERFGACFFEARVTSITRHDALFTATAASRSWSSRTVILATGVEDRWAAFPGYEDYIGRSLHWCGVCDGYEMAGQRVVVIGNDAEAAELAIQLLRHTQDVTLITNDPTCCLPQSTVDALTQHGIPLIVDRLRGARAGAPGFFESIVLERGDVIAVDHVFSAQGSTPNTAIIECLDVWLTERGHVAVDSEAKTSVDGLFAAGDITGLHSHQVLTAAHEGATAAMAADYALGEASPAADETRQRRLPLIAGT